MNTKLIKSLDILVSYNAELAPWLRFLSILAEKEIRLRFNHLEWGAKRIFSWKTERGAQERSFGDNLQFVHALAKIQGLEELVIEGYYTKHWPSYLREKTGAQVRTRPGWNLPLMSGDFMDHEGYIDEFKLVDGDFIDHDGNIVKFKHDLHRRELKKFVEYQQGTEDLIP